MSWKTRAFPQGRVGAAAEAQIVKTEELCVPTLRAFPARPRPVMETHLGQIFAAVTTGMSGDWAGRGS